MTWNSIPKILNLKSSFQSTGKKAAKGSNNAGKNSNHQTMGEIHLDLHFADDIDGLEGSEEELKNLLKNLDEKCKAAGMEIGA